MPHPLLAPALSSSLNYLQATGGVVTYFGNYKIHTLDSSQDFIITKLADASIVGGNDLEYLLLGAGAGGGGNQSGGAGGGGAGEMLTGTVTATVGTFPFVCGTGGIGGVDASTNGTPGGTSTWYSLTAVGGGYGARQGTVAGGSGACGGGGSPVSGAGGAATAGNVGGNGQINAAPFRGGGGGGQAGVGGNGTTSGNGGNGALNSITGVATRYCAGGGGGCSDVTGAGPGGAGGGGDGGANTIGEDADANTGSGGGGGGGAGIHAGGRGADGKLIVRYLIK